MNPSMKFTMKNYVIINALLGVFLAAALILGPHLRMGSSFTAGFGTGLGAAWILFALVGWKELRRKGRGFDERVRAAYLRASASAFWILVLALSLSAALFRSPLLAPLPEPKDLAFYGMEVGLVSFLALFIVFERRS